MLKVYRILNYIVNGLIVLVLILFVRNIIIYGAPGGLFGLSVFLIGVVFIYSVLTSFYFVIKTSGISTKGNQKYTEMLDISFTGKADLRFRYDMLTGYSNIILAVALIVYFLYILIFDPIKEFHGEDLIAFLILLFSFLYSIIQIYYTATVIRLIKNSNN